MAHILLVDDDPGVLHALRKVFEAEGHRCSAYRNGAEAVESAPTAQPDVAFVDLAMPGMDGLQVLERLRSSIADLPVVMITAYGDLNSAVHAVQAGAYDYLSKPLDLQRVRVVARRAVEARGLMRQVADLDRSGHRPQRGPRLVGRHPSMIEVFKRIGAVSAAGSRSTVLVLGETGTGKGLVARAIHAAGPSQAEPFVVAACAALPEPLVEAELFGHERGAFTGAVAQRSGKLEAAGHGTVFLDEVGDLSPGTQQKLLRVLDTGEFERLGSNEVLECRARFVAATHRDLGALVRRGAFREDLYFRLAVVLIEVPPLRARREDIPLLVDHLLDRIAARTGRNWLAVSREALEMLVSYDYPGNVRQLEHLLERAVAEAPGQIILPEHLQLPSATPAELRPAAPPTGYREARRQALASFERQFVESALLATGGNVTAAAERAGMARQSFQRLMERHAIRSGPFRRDG